jgi:hypothetical protein
MNPVRKFKNFLKEKVGKIWEKFEKPKVFTIYIILAIIGLIAFSLIILSYFFPDIIPDFLKGRFQRKTGQEEVPNVAEPFKPTPLPLAHGRQTYTISGSEEGSPRITEATIDPLDVSIGGSQTFSVEARDQDGITSLKAVLVTDEGEQENLLRLTDGSNKLGTWQGNWRVTTSFDYTYRVRIEAKDALDNESSVTLTFR